jgi:hypothetical protein
MLSQQTKEFYDRWLNKANSYNAKLTPSLEDYFDKFFTLYVIYNRLYAEVAKVLEEEGKISSLKNKTTFPDRQAATNYVCQYVKASSFIQTIESDEDCCNALSEIIKLLEDNRFYVNLDKITGYPKKELDLDFISVLKEEHKKDKQKKALAILQLIYAVRCNMFHGSKQFISEQSYLIKPIITLLQKVIDILYRKLSGQNS